MRGRVLLAIGLVAVAACNDGVSSEGLTKVRGGDGTATLAGTVYGFTAAPDSQRVALEGARVILSWVGEFPPPVDTADGPEPPPPGPDTMLTIRTSVRSLLDTVLSPPDTIGQPPPPPPPPTCQQGEEVATLTTASDGTWRATGLDDGIYNVIVLGPTGSQWMGGEYCNQPVSSEREENLTFYLQFGPGPDPVP